MSSNDFTRNGVPLVGGIFVEREWFIERYVPPIEEEVVDSYSIWSWGSNGVGQLGTNNTTDRSSPVQVITKGQWLDISLSSYFSLAIKNDNSLWGWGSNSSGQLGTNDIVNRSSPTQISANGEMWFLIDNSLYTSMALKHDGTLWLWGDNNNGQLGDNTRISKSSPVQTIAGGSYWNKISLGSTHASSIKTDGTLWLWGWNGYGQLGTNNTINTSSPIQTISGGNNWKNISCGGYSTLATKLDNSLWGWGDNDYGQLGTNSIIRRSSPVQILEGTTWFKISSNDKYSLGIKTDGTLWVWGYNFNYQLGDATNANRSSPVQISIGGTDWYDVSGHTLHSAAIKTDGTLWLWGYNGFGQLGLGDILNRSFPIQNTMVGYPWMKISLGYNHTGGIVEIQG